MMCPRVHLYTWCALIAALLIVYIPRYQRWATSSFPGLGTPPAGSSKCRTLPAPAQETPRKNKQNETVAWQKSEVLIVTWYAAADSFSGFINNDGAGLGKNTIITQKTFRRTEKEHARSSSSLLLKTKKKRCEFSASRGDRSTYHTSHAALSNDDFFCSPTKFSDLTAEVVSSQYLQKKKRKNRRHKQERPRHLRRLQQK